MSDLENPQQGDIRAFLRVLGPAMMVAGLLFTIVGLASFFSAFGGFEPPRNFSCAFVGMPLMAAGAGISKFAYIGAVTRYIAGEVALVGRDVTNYMVEGTKDSIRDVATAIGEGFATAHSPHALRCAKCGAENEASANFCRECGAPFAKTKRCEKCGDLNDAEARFCDHCGAAVA